MADDYPRIDVTVDVVALTHVDGRLHVLVVRRGNPPFEGRWALPGGYLGVDEDLAPAAARELHEETGISLHPDELRQLAAYGAPTRDPRNRTVSVAHLAQLDRLEPPRGGSDADDARWVAISDLMEGEALAFDHATILRDAVAASRWGTTVSD